MLWGRKKDKDIRATAKIAVDTAIVFRSFVAETSGKMEVLLAAIALLIATHPNRLQLIDEMRSVHTILADRRPDDHPYLAALDDAMRVLTEAISTQSK